METKILREPIDRYKPALWIQELFRLLNATYLQRWSSLASNKNSWLYIMREWEKDLKDFSGEEINQALDRIKKRKNEKGEINQFPPTSAEFAHYAGAIKKFRLEQQESEKRRANVINIEQKHRVLVNRNSDEFKEAVKNNLEKMRAQYGVQAN